MNNSFSQIKRALPEEKFLLPVFAALALLLLLFNIFPALSGDEYGSLVESQNLGTNLHAMSYFLSLRLWSSISQQDWFLRTLSLLWLFAGLFWLDRWLAMERVPDGTRKLVVWLAVLSPFLWWYGLQIRFYATFFAASILFAWRFRAWQAQPTVRNLGFLLLGILLLLSSHLFGLLVIGIVLLDFAWENLPAKRRWLLVLVLGFGIMLLYSPAFRSMLITGVVRITNASSAPESMRGISLAMLAKLPLTFYTFTMGERVYPLWWWVTLPAMLVMGAAFLLGIGRLLQHPPLASLSVFMVLSIPFLYLVLDPLAPPSLQGAAPRYLIFVVPYFLYVLALGAGLWKPLVPALILVSLMGLFFIARPSWSNGSSDLVDWRRLLAEAAPLPAQACILTDGRAYEPVKRYAPSGARVTREEMDCLGFSRIVLVSNDHRLGQVRYLDEVASKLSNEYGLVSNTTVFPAQVTVYDKNAGSSPVIPSRLDLPEQDFLFPLSVSTVDKPVQGFVRLDENTREVQIPLSIVNAAWVLTNFRSEIKLPKETPVFKLEYTLNPGNEKREMILRSGMETAAWDGECDFCIPVYKWKKLLHLVGSSSYPGAYRQYSAYIWGFQLLDGLPSEHITSIKVTYLLPDGVGYFYGVYPEEN